MTQIVDLRSPEPQVLSNVEQYGHAAIPNQPASTGVRASHTGIKREANDDGGDGAPKRIKGPHTAASRPDPFVATINAAIEEYRDKDESEKRDLQEKITVLEAQLQKANGRKVGSESSGELFDDSPARLREACQSNTSPISVVEVDLLPVNDALWTKIRDKHEELCDKHAELLHKNKLLAEKDERLHKKNNELRLKIADIRTKDEQLRIYEDRFGTTLDDLSDRQDRKQSHGESENRVAEEKLKDLEIANAQLFKDKNKICRGWKLDLKTYGVLSEKNRKAAEKTRAKRHAEHAAQIRFLNKQNSNDQQTRDKRIQDLESEVTETKRKLRAEHAVQIKSLNDQHFNDRVMDQATYQKALKQDQKELKECHRNLKNQESSMNMWKGRTNDMYIAYREVYDKNERLVKKLEAVMTAGSFDSQMSAKNRKTLEKLKSCRLDELSAFHED
ncbi:uncharacterized protein N0V89_012420 [Didymosphaeria variabile]|uniref:Uncharacterized protein n=1 Tax=Didymosphaeria variabile TaxID=1932322 RepID=A0A9W8X9J9_9PLEO|nr:uncharacterized protein N0V89_012420 [Didymosphaeria variabile]KAJ4344676.1 hypothetical protein N0V89_012420 [Didymosphaeria variabile]